jgi:pilus assembly protein CpaC
MVGGVFSFPKGAEKAARLQQTRRVFAALSATLSAELAPRAIAVALAAVAAAPGAALAQTDAVGGARSVIRIAPNVMLPVTRQVTMGEGKALMVELPQDSTDVIVSHTDTIDATVHTARRIMLYGKKIGAANVFILGRDGRQLLVLDIAIKRDLSELGQMLRRLIPSGRISVSSSGEGVVISGNVTQPTDATRAEEIAKQYVKNAPVVNLLTVSEREQVLLKVTVAEIQREAIRRLGVDLPQALMKGGAMTFGKVIQNAFPVSTAVAAAAGFNGAGTVPSLQSGTALQATANWNGNTASAIIQSFERVGLARTLAEPSLAAISGETAKFLAGGEFPIPVSSNNNTVTVSWKTFGVNVAFTPYVLTQGRINLKVSAEVSELSTAGAVSTAGFSIQGLQVRRAETTVEMPSGSALAIAGLLSEQTRQGVEGVPELRNLPILGALFRSKDFRNNQSELVIMVTPIIVRPNEASQFSRPDEGFAPASDLKGLFLGHLNRVYKSTARLGPNIVNGDLGYIIEYPNNGVAP